MERRPVGYDLHLHEAAAARAPRKREEVLMLTRKYNSTWKPHANREKESAKPRTCLVY
jgi:hypothetical protein